MQPAVFSKHRLPCEQRRAEREGRAWEAQEGRAVRAKEPFADLPLLANRNLAIGKVVFNADFGVDRLQVRF